MFLMDAIPGSWFVAKQINRSSRSSRSTHFIKRPTQQWLHSCFYWSADRTYVTFHFDSSSSTRSSCCEIKTYWFSIMDCTGFTWQQVNIRQNDHSWRCTNNIWTTLPKNFISTRDFNKGAATFFIKLRHVVIVKVSKTSSNLQMETVQNYLAWLMPRVYWERIGILSSQSSQLEGFQQPLRLFRMRDERVFEDTAEENSSLIKIVTLNT